MVTSPSDEVSTTGLFASTNWLPPVTRYTVTPGSAFTAQNESVPASPSAISWFRNALRAAKLLAGGGSKRPMNSRVQLAAGTNSVKVGYPLASAAALRVATAAAEPH